MRLLAFAAAVALLPLPSRAQGPGAAAPADSTVAWLAPLVGRWGPPADAGPQAAGRVVHDYQWVVGEKALRIAEGYRLGEEAQAELAGLVFWDVSREQVRFIAVAGRGDGQGRYFEGEYRLLADGAIERTYDVYYRTLADTPGEQLGGSRRRFREVYRLADGNRIEATLDWWRDGAWTPFGPGRYTVERISRG